MDFWAVADKYGLPIAMLLFGVFALYFDWVVSGKRYEKVLRERDQLFRLAFSSAQMGKRNANIAERALAIIDHREPETDGGDDQSD